MKKETTTKCRVVRTKAPYGTHMLYECACGRIGKTEDIFLVAFHQPTATLEDAAKWGYTPERLKRVA